MARPQQREAGYLRLNPSSGMFQHDATPESKALQSSLNKAVPESLKISNLLLAILACLV
jgi:hypothetical protein